LTATLSYTNSEVIRADFAALDIVSDTFQGSLGYRLPFRVEPDSYFLFDVAVTGEATDSELAGLAFQTTDIIEIVPQLSWSKQWPRHSFSVSGGLKLGTADTLGVSLTEGSYQMAFASANYAQRLGESLGLEVIAIGQLAFNQNLPVPRLISAGGITTVRGYPNNVRSGDSGLILRTQLSRLVPWTLGERVNVTPLAFADGALVVPFRIDGGIDTDQDVLLSVGAGMRFDVSDSASGLLMVGVPLRETLGFTDTNKGVLYAGFDYRF
jgi:hemolysin activation/secretion protein